jgi:hypothetical protein
MTDIVERLRNHETIYAEDAADEITRLRAELATARNDTLEEAARVAEDFPKTYTPNPPEIRKRFTIDDMSTYSSAACRMVAEDIRALKGDG